MASNQATSTQAPKPDDISLTPKSSINVDFDLREVHFSTSGFWKTEDMKAFLRDMSAKGMPLIGEGKPIYALGDMSGFVAQSRATGEAITNHLMAVKDHGLKRIAIVGASALVKVQYTRLSKGVDVEFFASKQEGLAWLRANR